MKINYLLLLLLGFSYGPTFAQKGELLWKEDFNNINNDVWSFETGNGDWGWGNGELQYYTSDNTSILPITGEENNSAIVIEVKKEQKEGFQFTSSRLISEKGLAVRYGLIEVRMKVPTLGNAIWPAFWMMGTDQQQWPQRGEIDIMEMGHKQSVREHHSESDIDNFVGSNIILYADAACSPGNPTCAGSAAYDVNYANPYVSTNSLAERFVLYRMYWSSDAIRLTVVDGEVEHEMFNGPFSLEEGTETEVFQKPFFFLFNMAVGGNFTDASSSDAVNIANSSKMWIDYISVHQWNNEGEVFVGEIEKPAVAITSPTSHSLSNQTPILLEANASSQYGIRKVDFYIGDSLVGTSNTPPYQHSIANIETGDYLLKVKATDNKGNTASTTDFSLYVSDNSGEGEVIWKENFTTIDRNIWTFETGNGDWGWGNGELEFYTENNASIQSIPNEAGNTALVITAKEEAAGGYNYTSSRIKSEDGIAIQYGVIDVRMKVPDLGNALWPAFWMMGTDHQQWPQRGEIDIMEMGHKLSTREREGHGDVSTNHFVGSNIILYSESACSPENPTCAGSAAYDIDYSTPYTPTTSLANKFVNYKMYWSPSEIRITIVDEGIEYDLFAGPFGLEKGTDSEVFQKPFFFLMNMAIGGNFTDAPTNNDVNFTAPAEMWIDYIKVSKWNGRGEVFQGKRNAKTGKYAVFTDNNEIENGITVGVNANVFVWENSLLESDITAFEGSSTLSWKNAFADWFGGGIAVKTPENMTDYAEGSLHFAANVPADLSFKVGIISSLNESWIEFPANQTQYGLERTGEWEEVNIPIQDFGLIDLTQVEYFFAVEGLAGTKVNQSFSFDDIYWDDTPLISKAPKVSLLNPSNGTVLDDLSPITFRSSAYDLDGTIATVQYFVNDSLIGESHTAPYEVVWNNVTSGEHKISAIAKDDANISSNMETAEITIINIAEGIGEVLWIDNFNTVDKNFWQFEHGNGDWGWGNGELEYYTEKNTSVKAIPNETDNNALIITAKREDIRGFSFTSSRLKSQDKLAVKYGVVEARIRVPDLEGGLWPAFWLLGTGSQGWPAIGEMDIMEMGHNEADRLKHLEDSTVIPHVNHFTGSNLFWKSQDACSDGNPTCAANGTWFKGSATPYVSQETMANRFVTYRMYWSPKEIRYTVLDNGIEHDLLPAPFNIESGDGIDAFHQPFYILLNMAVGGLFPDILDASGITANFPAEMWVDYVKVSKWNGVGKVYTAPVTNKKEGLYAVFSDLENTDSQMTFGVDADVFVWENTFEGGSTPAYHGNNVLAWKTAQANWWFGAGLTSREYIDLTNYQNGTLRFKVKIPADVGFKIGIETADTQYWVDFKANEEKYGLVRNGEWGEAIVPIADFNGINLLKVTSPFLVLSGEGGMSETFELAFDDILYDPTVYPSIAPTVTITSPVDNLQLETATSLLITAEATDTDGTITNVAFYDGSQLIGLATEAPYAIQWNAITQGSHIISVKATDNSGVSSSASIKVEVTGDGIGEVIWKEDFNNINSETWSFEIGNGNWGWGNGELEYYREENASIAPIPNDPTNSALVIEAKEEAFGGKNFTSSRMITKDKLAIQYGVIDVRMKTPDVSGGLWPAAWLLGTGAGDWPNIGEVDLMEMGQNFEDRARQGFPHADVNHYTASNIIWYSDDALSPQNPTGAASAAWDPNYANPYEAETSLADRFVTYRMYWSPTSIQLSIIDGEIEHFMFAAPYHFTDNDTFKKPFYFLLNMAVGGVFTDAHADAHVSANFPAKMYVDYIQVSKWNGHGEVFIGKQENKVAEGRFGIYTEETVVNEKITAGLDADIYLWNNLTPVEGTPSEGNYSIAWKNNSSSSWYGGGIHSRQLWNLNNYLDDTLKLQMKLPEDVGIRLGFTTTSSEHWVNIGASESPYGLVRNGEWSSLSIPIEDFNATDLSEVNAPFIISSLDPLKDSIYTFEIDNIYWESKEITSPIVDFEIGVPVNGSTYMVGETLSLSAKTFSPTNTVEKVTYYYDGIKVEEVTDAPFTSNINNITYGEHTLYAEVKDASGTMQSSTKTIQVIEGGIIFELPEVTLTSITNNQVIYEGTPISLEVNTFSVNSAIEKVEYYNGLNKIGESTVSPFSFNWENAGIGQHPISAKVYDAITSNTSETVVISVEEQNCIPTNITLGKTVSMSSQEGFYLPENAIDNNLSTRSSTMFSVPQWFKIDLGKSYNIETVKLVWERANADAYYILMSDEDTEPNPSSWTIISDQSGLEDKARTDSLVNLSGSGRYIALYATSKQHPYGISLFEFEVYPTCSTTNNTPPVAIASISEENGTYQFDASASFDSDGDQLSYHWDFGDGTTTTSITTSHHYLNNDTYDITLSVTDGLSTSTDIQTIVFESINNNHCFFSSENGDFTAEVENTDQPIVTFTPTQQLGETDWVIMTIMKDGINIGGYVMHQESNQFVYQTSLSLGDNIELFFTYQHDAYGQKDTTKDRYALEIGGCSSNARENTSLDLETELTLYPNPSQGVFTINFDHKTINTSGVIRVIDSTGKEIYFNKISMIKTKTINLGHKIPSGLYHVIIQNQNNTYTKTMILQ